jgi:hypothetical protein
MGLAAIIGALTKATQLSGPLLAALLIFPTLGMAAAPFNSWAAQRAALPQDLRDRRRTEYRRTRQAFAAGATTGGVVAVLGVAIAAIALLLAPSHHPVHTPNLLGPAQGHAAPHSPGRSRHPGPGRAPTPRPRPPSPSATPSPTSPTPTGTSTTSPPTPPSPSPTISPSP